MKSRYHDNGDYVKMGILGRKYIDKVQNLRNVSTFV